MATTGASLEVVGLTELVADLKGPMFRSINNQLRVEAELIARKLVPTVQAVVRNSAAPQAPAFVGTVRAKRDRVPLIAIGAINPKFQNSKFTRRGAGDSKARRGSMAHGILFGPKGGKKSTPMSENYYRIPRNEDALADALSEYGVVTRHATNLYLEAFIRVLRTNGWEAT